MSNPSDVSEKVVWLEQNLIDWLDFMSEREEIEDFVSIVLARTNVKGAEEMYELLREDMFTSNVLDEDFNYGGSK